MTQWHKIVQQSGPIHLSMMLKIEERSVSCLSVNLF